MQLTDCYYNSYSLITLKWKCYLLAYVYKLTIQTTKTFTDICHIYGNVIGNCCLNEGFDTVYNTVTRCYYGATIQLSLNELYCTYFPQYYCITYYITLHTLLNYMNNTELWISIQVNMVLLLHKSYFTGTSQVLKTILRVWDWNAYD